MGPLVEAKKRIGLVHVGASLSCGIPSWEVQILWLRWRLQMVWCVLLGQIVDAGIVPKRDNSRGCMC